MKKEKYIKEADEIQENAPVLHPNRNTQKKKEHQLTKQEDKEEAQAGKNEIKHIPHIGQVRELPYRMNKEELVSLIKKCKGHCVSMYLPSNDPIAFKARLKEAEQQGENFGLKDIQRLLEPGYALIQQEDVWQSSGQGLAFFSTQGFAGYVRLPEAPEQEVLVNDHFLLKPMIPYMNEGGYFYLLTLSKHQAKLFKGDRFSLQFVEAVEAPKIVDDIAERDEVDIAEVARTVEKEILAREHAPLLLAGVDYLHPIFMRATHYKNIVETGLVGNYDQISIPALHKQAMEKMQPVFDADVQRHLDEYYNKCNGPLASQIQSDVIPAAWFGQAGRLFIQEGAHIWGHFDPATQQLDMHDEQQPGDDCLINEAAMQVLLNGGYVHILPKEQMPEGAVVAALFRYP